MNHSDIKRARWIGCAGRSVLLVGALSCASENVGTSAGETGAEGGGTTSGEASTSSPSDDSASPTTAPEPTGDATGGTTGHGTGESTTAATDDGSAPACADAEKRCTYRFKYADQGERSVEVRGNFAPEAWDVGTPMQKDGSTWTADVEIPYEQDVEYKFVLDGTVWITDPGNRAVVDDGNQNFNSLLEALTCTDFSCP
jgi:hypothetical protein